jgi:hypothetical protein
MRLIYAMGYINELTNLQNTLEQYSIPDHAHLILLA